MSDERLVLQVTDDGIGIADSQMRGRESLGLLGMQERAQFFGGQVNIGRRPDGGTAVSVSIPLSRPQP
jgi:signal transduction histidine kinase